MAQGKPFERSQHQGNPSQNADLVAYFSEAATTGRGNCIDDVVYIEIDEAERRAFPQLAGCYGVGFQLQAVDGERSSVLYSRLNLNSLMTCWLPFHVWAAAANRARSSVTPNALQTPERFGREGGKDGANQFSLRSQ
jgi:hypothetical protein